MKAAKYTREKMTSNLAPLIARAAPEAYFVGGAVRDALLRRTSGDIDIVLPKERLKQTAFALARALKATAFEMDAEFGVWRLTAKTGLQIDLAAYQGKNIKEDLLRRDFTVNALALPVGAKCKITYSKAGFKFTLNSKDLLDYTGGLKDLKAKTLHSTSAKIFKEDPLRMLRAYRAASELNFKISPAVTAQIKKDKKLISRPSGERVREELVRLFSAPKAYEYLLMMDGCGLLSALLPALEPQRKCATVYYGKGGVLKHTLLVVKRMEWCIENLKKIWPKHYKKLAPFVKEKHIYIMAALLHDIAKPATAAPVNGRLRFFYHEEKGAEMAKEILASLRYSTAEIRLICNMIARHLRPSNLASNGDISDKSLYKFFKLMGDAAIPMLLLCWADYASYVTDAQLRKILKRSNDEVISIEEGRAEGPFAKTLRHMQVISFMFKKYFHPQKKILPQKLLNGKEIMKILNLPPGPKVGEYLELLAEAQVEGKITDKHTAEQYLKKLKK